MNNASRFALLILIATLWNSPSQADSFAGLGFLAGGGESRAYGISADGGTIIGTSDGVGLNGSDVVRWDAAGVATRVSQSTFSWPAPSAVSANGSTIVGSEILNSGLGGFVWSDAGGYQNRIGWGLSAVSADGSAYGGYDGNGGVIFTSTGAISTGGNNVAGLTADGATALVTEQWGAVGGYTFHDTYTWTKSGGLTSIGHRAGMGKTLGTAISADGSTIVGRDSSENYLRNGEAFLWTADDGFIGLGRLGDVGTSGASALTTSGLFGTMVVGSSAAGIELGQADGRAFLWTSDLGMVDLKSFLTSRGADLTGWTLTGATGISADGTTIVGNGVDAYGRDQAWIARLSGATAVPEPASLAMLALGGLAAGMAARRSRRAT